MIYKKDLFPIGTVGAPHGINGEMSFSFTTDVFDTDDAEFFVFEVDGIFVPFFIHSYRFKTNSTALLLLDGVDSDTKAREFSGRTIFLPKEFLEKVEDSDLNVDYFVGFRIEDIEGGDLGRVSEVDQSTQNVLFVVRKEGREDLLVPAADDFVQSINHEEKIIFMALPPGLLDI